MDEVKSKPQPSVEKETEVPKTAAAQQPQKMVVDVKGQIKLPGVYQATEGERVIDLITKAGGLTENAEASQVNFAQRVEDEMVIYIPAKGEEAAQMTPASGTGGITGGSSSKQSRES